MLHGYRLLEDDSGVRWIWAQERRRKHPVGTMRAGRTQEMVNASASRAGSAQLEVEIGLVCFEFPCGAGTSRRQSDAVWWEGDGARVRLRQGVAVGAGMHVGNGQEHGRLWVDGARRCAVG
ncbi:hypothetical protein B0H10DRAFT_2032236 [Mycena sp. CBHHK59/15]|nr:hypothetical protein B0H10DRAFT_2063172 [Mycena sp. CBHHK59/15]KAJ6617607.1 hypothetical protein B0H10DRAFT_2032236 [Mycena sp. CBHHK59/15]